MPETLVRTRGPALLVVLELEGPPRIGIVAYGQSEADRLTTWLAWTPSAAETIFAAIADLDARGGLERSQSWHEALGDADRSPL